MYLSRYKYCILLWRFAVQRKVAAGSVAENACNVLGLLIKTELHGGEEIVSCYCNYAGSQRLVSKLGNGRFNNHFRPGVYGLTAGGVNYIERIQSITQSREEYIRNLGIAPGPPHIKGIYADPAYSGVSYPDGGTPSNTYVPAGWPRQVIPLQDKDPNGPPGAPIQYYPAMSNETAEPGFAYEGAGQIEESGRYFYHGDHLGSTSFVTDARGRVSQYVAYMPYGEALFEEHSNTRDMPYLFNAKERDEETGLYYYGARYLDPETAVWYGVDPLVMKYLDYSPYAYCMGNPLMFIDPDGNDPVPAASRNVIGTPAYYQWRYNDFVARNPDATAPGYYLDYGFKYAQRFQNQTNEKLSKRGQKWLGETMVNLQVAMERRLTDPVRADGTELELNPQAFKDFAFASHVNAYWNNDGSAPLYTLNTVDLFAIVLTPDLNDLTSKEGLTQAGAIMGKLGEYWLDNPKVAMQRAGELMLNQNKIEKMILEKAGTEMGDRANKLYEQLKSHITNSTE
jgi:RHS repeat-associated protein